MLSLCCGCGEGKRGRGGREGREGREVREGREEGEVGREEGEVRGGREQMNVKHTKASEPASDVTAPTAIHVHVQGAEN